MRKLNELNQKTTPTTADGTGAERLDEVATGLEEFRGAFNAVAYRLGFSKDEVIEVNRDLDWAVYALRYVAAAELELASSRSVCEALLAGPEGSLPPESHAYRPPSLPASSTPPMGIFFRVQMVLSRIQAHPTYTPELGRALGISETDPAWPDLLVMRGARRGTVWTALAA
jgi:hypothetical protein